MSDLTTAVKQESSPEVATSMTTTNAEGGEGSAGDAAEPLNKLMNRLKDKSSLEGGESGSSSNGGNNSDNSALVSIGNASFGFNFDSEEGMSHSTHPNSEQNDNSDSDGGDAKQAAKGAEGGSSDPKPQETNTTSAKTAPPAKEQKQVNVVPMSTSTSSLTNSSVTTSNTPQTSDAPAAAAQHSQAAANAVASLQSIANSYASAPASGTSGDNSQSETYHSSSDMPRKRKANRLDEKASSSVTSRNDDDSAAGYNTDDDEDLGGESGGGSGKGRKKKKLDEKKREERNAREKERSFRISKQINELRSLLSSGGVIVPKGTKSSVLTEAANYIRMLQQHQYRSEIDRHQLIQQVQMIGSGAHGPQAASAIRQIAAQNGIWSLGNFGGVPPKAAMSAYQPSGSGSTESAVAQPVTSSDATNDALQPTKIDVPDYRYIFNSCGVAMAIASMGGAFIDCNMLFCELSSYTKQEVCSLTIFNLTARQDLQQAFDQISQLISPPLEQRDSSQPPKPIVLRGAMKNRNDVGLSVALIKGEDGIAKCFCVTLVQNPASPYESAKPIPLSFDAIQAAAQQGQGGAQSGFVGGSGKSDMKTAQTYISG